MKRFLILFAAAVALAVGVAMTSSCRKSNIQKPSDIQKPSEPAKVRISPVFTKVTETAFEKGDAIGVNIILPSGPYATNACMTYDGNLFSSDLEWYDSDARSTVKAWYPYSSSVPGSFTVKTDQSGGLSSSDFVAGTQAGVIPSVEPVSLSFTHRMSRLEVVITNNTEKVFSDLRIGGLVADASLSDDFVASANPSGSKVDITPCLINDRYYLIFPPQSASLTVKFSLDGSPREMTIPTASFAAGFQNTIELTETSVKLSGHITGWDSTPGGNTDDPSELPEKLYIYFWAWGDATNAQEMEKTADGVFSWTGDCSPWEFKFLTSNATSDDYWTGYFRDDSASDYWTLREGGAECMFKLNDKGMSAGNYTITANLNTLKVTVVENVTSTSDNLYIYFWEWETATNASQMTALGNGKFTWSGICPRYNMKFTTSNASSDDYWTGYFRNPDAEDYWTLKEGSNQCMFDLNGVGRDGWWTINVDLNTMKVEVIPHVWLIGSAFSWGWDRSTAEEMTYLGDHQFTWTGTITNSEDGLFKFLVRQDGDWYGYWRNSTETNYWVAGETGEGDVQFEISEAGIASGTEVTITLNTSTGAVVIASVE